MNNALSEAKKVISQMGFGDVEIIGEKKRLLFADACMDTDRKKIYIYGNEPSLKRLGMVFLVLHEIAHLIYRDKYQSSPDEDFTKEFQQIEQELREDFWKLIIDE